MIPAICLRALPFFVVQTSLSPSIQYMKKLLFCLLLLGLLFSSTILNGQIHFEEGYLIDNSGKKIDCLIKNLNWKNNPSSIKYKLIGSDEIRSMGIEQLREFSIAGYSKYIRETVPIDLTSTVDTKLEPYKKPSFEDKTILLESLIVGSNSLYRYESGSEVRYFFKTPNTDFEQLIYSKYLSARSEVKENSAYKFQLSEIMCGEMDNSILQSIEYEFKDLVGFFQKLNECDDANYEVWNSSRRQPKKTSFYVSASARSSSLDFKSGGTFLRSLELKNMPGISAGFNAEVYLPFNKNKWSIFGGLLGRRLFNQGEVVVVSYHTVELVAGLRHYFYLNEDSQIFVNPIYTYAFNIDAKLEHSTLTNFTFGTNQNFGLGAGYAFKRYQAEVRYEHCRNLTGNFVRINSCFTSISFHFRYKV